jgi:hypothetical protein
VIVQHAVTHVVLAWSDATVDSERAIDAVLSCFVHPSLLNPSLQLHQDMIGVVQIWITTLSLDKKQRVLQGLTSQGVKNGLNHDNELRGRTEDYNTQTTIIQTTDIVTATVGSRGVDDDRYQTQSTIQPAEDTSFYNTTTTSSTMVVPPRPGRPSTPDTGPTRVILQWPYNVDYNRYDREDYYRMGNHQPPPQMWGPQDNTYNAGGYSQTGYGYDQAQSPTPQTYSQTPVSYGQSQSPPPSYNPSSYGQPSQQSYNQTPVDGYIPPSGNSYGQAPINVSLGSSINASVPPSALASVVPVVGSLVLPAANAYGQPSQESYNQPPPSQTVQSIVSGPGQSTTGSGGQHGQGSANSYFNAGSDDPQQPVTVETVNVSREVPF